jgi:hypothetical protein
VPYSKLMILDVRENQKAVVFRRTKRKEIDLDVYPGFCGINLIGILVNVDTSPLDLIIISRIFIHNAVYLYNLNITHSSHAMRFL